MNAQLLARDREAALPILANLIATETRVPVYVGGNENYSDGKAIWLQSSLVPANADDWAGLEASTKLKYGLLAHEVGHILHSDFSCISECSSDTERSLLNALEDPREENVFLARYPGFDVDLKFVSEWMVNEGRDGAADADAKPADLLVNYVHHAARLNLRDDEVYVPIIEQDGKRLAEVLSPAAKVRIDALVAGSSAMNSTRDALELTKRIVRVLDELAEEPPESSPANADGSTGGPTGASASGSGSPTTSQRQAIRDALSQSGVVDKAADRSKALSSGLQQQQKDLIDSGKYSPVDLSDAPGGADTGQRGLKLGGAIDSSEVQKASALLRMRLAATMQALVEAHVEHDRYGTTIDESRLHYLFTGERDVFVEVDEAEEIDTAIVLLCDVSGSMDGPRINVACNALLAAAMAFAAVPGVALASATFPGFAWVTPFGQSIAATNANYALGCFGGTPLKEGLMWVSQALAQRSEQRKLIVVLTDGQPDDTLGAIATIRLVERVGIEVIGLGIQTNSVKNVFRHAQTIWTLDELPKVLLETLEQRLTHRRAA